MTFLIGTLKGIYDKGLVTGPPTAGTWSRQGVVGRSKSSSLSVPDPLLSLRIPLCARRAVARLGAVESRVSMT